MIEPGGDDGWVDVPLEQPKAGAADDGWVDVPVSPAPPRRKVRGLFQGVQEIKTPAGSVYEVTAPNGEKWIYHEKPKPKSDPFTDEMLAAQRMKDDPWGELNKPRGPNDWGGSSDTAQPVPQTAKEKFMAFAKKNADRGVVGQTVDAVKGYYSTIPRVLGQGILSLPAAAIEKITGAPLDDESLLGQAVNSNAFEAPDTAGGMAGGAVGDAAAYMLGGEVLGGGPAASKVRAMLKLGGTFGATQGAQGYHRAVQAGLDPERAKNYALAQAAIGAGTAMLPMGNVFEGTAKALVPNAVGETAKNVIGKTVGTAAEIEALNTLNNMAERNFDPGRDLYDQSGLVHLAPQVLAMKGLGAKLENQTATEPVSMADILAGRVGKLGVPESLPENPTQRELARGQFQVQRGNQADDMITNQMLDWVDKNIPKEVRRELSDYYDAQRIASQVPVGFKRVGGETPSKIGVNVEPSLGAAETQAKLADNPAMADVFQPNVQGAVPVTGWSNESYGPRTPIGQLENPQVRHNQTFLETRAEALAPMIESGKAKLAELEAIKNPSKKVQRQIDVLRSSLDNLTAEDFALRDVAEQGEPSPAPQSPESIPQTARFQTAGQAGEFERTPVRSVGLDVVPTPEVKPLSPEAQKFLPVLQDAQRRLYDSYNALAKARGAEPVEYDPWYLPKVVTNHEPGEGSPDWMAKRTSGSQKAVELYAFREYGNPDGEVLIRGRNGEMPDGGRGGLKPVADAMGIFKGKDGKTYIRTSASKAEVEGQTDVRYNEEHDPFAAVLFSHRDTNRAFRMRDWVDQLAKSNMVQDERPEGEDGKRWVKASPAITASAPELEGKFLSPAMNDYLNSMVTRGSKPTWVEKLGHFLRGIKFTNPVAHPPNQITHFLGAYGAKDLVRGNLIGDLDWAKGQLNQLHDGRVTPEMQEMLNGGLATLSTPEGSRASDTTRRMNEALGRDNMNFNDPGDYGADARQKGILGVIGRMNREYTWKWDDMFRIALARKTQREHPDWTMRQVVDNVSQYFPDYQIGALQKNAWYVHHPIMKNTMMFNRFHYQSAESMLNTAADTLGRKPLSGLNHIGGLGAAWLLKEGLSGAVRGFTQDDEVAARPGGPLGLGEKVYQSVRDRDAQPVFDAMTSLAPVTELGLLGKGMVSPLSPAKALANKADAALANAFWKSGDYDKALEIESKLMADKAKAVSLNALPLGAETKRLQEGESVPDVLVKMLGTARKDRSRVDEILLNDFYAKGSRKTPYGFFTESTQKGRLDASIAAKKRDTDSIQAMIDNGDLTPKDGVKFLKKAGMTNDEIRMDMFKKAGPEAAVAAFANLEDEDEKTRLRPMIQTKVRKAIQTAPDDESKAKWQRLLDYLGTDAPLIRRED